MEKTLEFVFFWHATEQCLGLSSTAAGMMSKILSRHFLGVFSLLFWLTVNRICPFPTILIFLFFRRIKIRSWFLLQLTGISNRSTKRFLQFLFYFWFLDQQLLTIEVFLRPQLFFVISEKYFTWVKQIEIISKELFVRFLGRSVPALSRQSVWGDGVDRRERRPLLRQEASAEAGGWRQPSHIRVQTRRQVQHQGFVFV